MNEFCTLYITSSLRTDCKSFAEYEVVNEKVKEAVKSDWKENDQLCYKLEERCTAFSEMLAIVRGVREGRLENIHVIKYCLVSIGNDLRRAHFIAYQTGCIVRKVPAAKIN